MSKVITFSRHFPAYHPKKGQPTYFVEQVLNSIGIKTASQLLPGVHEIINGFMMLDSNLAKHHTIRAGHRFKVGDKFSPRVWSGKPYNSKQIIIAPDIEIVKTWGIVINSWKDIRIDGAPTMFDKNSKLHLNDGLSRLEFQSWFNKLPFDGQIICWNPEIEY